MLVEKTISQLHWPVIILGSGPAGCTAGLYAARSLLSPLIFTGMQKGGQLTITTEIENYPGFAEPIDANFLMEQMALQAERAGATFVQDSIAHVDLNKRPFSLLSKNSKQSYSCDALIIATGAKARWLGLKSEEEFKGKGVSACATCDGFFYRGKPVVVVGGGNSAVEEALYLAKIASDVTLIHRRDQLRAEPILQKRLLNEKNISILWNHEIEEILGTKLEGARSAVVSHVKAKDVHSGEIKILETEGVFIAIGHSPASELFTHSLKCHSDGSIWTKSSSTETSVEGVFAAGDVADPKFRQAVTAAASGCMAALEVEQFLAYRRFKS